MPTITPTLLAAWRSKQHVGANAPACVVRITRGTLDKTYGPNLGTKPYDVIGGNNEEPWQGLWRSTDPEGPEGREIPNVLSVVWDINFQQKGLKTCVIEVEDVILEDESGVGGDFHKIIRGFMAPTRGAVVPRRPQSGSPTEWSEVFNNGYLITVFEGYGTEMVKTFRGFIDDCDIDTHPDRITLTCRSVINMALTDQRLMGFNKPPEIKAPTTFIDAAMAEERKSKPPHPKLKGYVSVHDIAAVIKAIVVWSGCEDFSQIHNTGASLVKGPFTYHMDQFYIDVIDNMLEGLNFVFYEKCPTSMSESNGQPVFEPNKALAPPGPALLQVTDQDLLESVQAKFDKSSLPFIVRVRGAPDKEGGLGYDEDTVKRFHAKYFPPWSGAADVAGEEVEAGRISGVRRHAFIRDERFLSNQECAVMAVLTAMQYALEAFTVSLQLPGFPGFELNEQISVIDEPTGVNSRLWISSLHSEHTLGKDAKWVMQVGGALLDTEDFTFLREDLAAATLGNLG